MKREQLNRVQRRTELMFFGVVFGVSVIMLLIINREIFQYLNERIENRKEFAEKLYAHNLQQTLEIYNYKLRELTERPDFKQAFARQDRKGLIQISQYLYAQGTRDLMTILTFRRKDGYTVYRAHMPAVYGDIVKMDRKIIAAVNRDQQVHYGFEIGKFEPTFRLVRPIFGPDGEYLGNVEAGFDLARFIRPLSILNDVKTHLLIQKSVAGAYEKKENLHSKGEYYLISKRPSIFDAFNPRDLHKDMIQKDFNRSLALYSVSRLNSADGNTAGYLVVTEDISEFLAEYFSIILNLLGFLTVGAVLFFILIKSNLRYFRKRIEETLYTDPLTGLGNYNALTQEISSNENYALILTDINDFHVINDVYGAKIGDMILSDYADHLHRFARENSMTVYRITSDEFVILKAGQTDDTSLKKLIQMLIQYIDRTTFTVEDKITVIDLNITAGAAHASPDAIEHAQRSLRKAQKRERTFEIYHERMDTRKESTEILNARNLIRYAISNNGVVPYFQPIVNQSREVVKHEVLMRLFDHSGKMYTPGQFMTTAHRMHLYTGLMVSLLEKVKTAYADWPEAVFTVNISVSDIYDHEIKSALLGILDSSEKKKRLIIEIIESENIVDFTRMNQFVETMKSRGALIAIDDFGSGYSNFSHILKMNSDCIKIDGSLIKDIMQNGENQILVKSIVDFANGLGIDVIAEFVENQETYELLRSFGVDQFQGYYFAKPGPLVS